MNLEYRIIEVYLAIEHAYRAITNGARLRLCGRLPELSDVEVLTIEIFGEMQGHHTDAAIWRYAEHHWKDWFPRLSGYKSFAKQCANLAQIKDRIFRFLYPPAADIHITDGVPMPVCHIVRANRCKIFKGDAAFGFCAVKDEHYYGFKGHVVVDCAQRIVAFTIVAANIDERAVLDNVRGLIKGLLIGDKGLLSKTRQAELAADGIDLQTPLRNNMPDPRPKKTVQTLMKIRRRVETVIGQLTEFFGVAKCKAKNLHHLSAKILRKIIAYNFTRTEKAC